MSSARVDLTKGTVVTVPELAKKLKISPSTAWRLILTKKIPSVRVGSLRRTTLEAAQAALAGPSDDDIEAECLAEGLWPHPELSTGNRPIANAIVWSRCILWYCRLITVLARCMSFFELVQIGPNNAGGSSSCIGS